MVLLSFPAYALEMAPGWELNGFLRNNTGFFTSNQDFTQNNDKLATERNWLRLKVNGKITDTLSIRLVGQGIWEPSYRIEEGSTVRTGEYDEADLREAYLTWKPVDGQMITLGRQIVTWGESLGFRVGDVINPADSRNGFVFANLEDSRIPQWMARGVHQLPSETGISFEWIVNPLWTEAKYRVDPLFAQSTSATPGANGSTITPGWRFAPYPETRLEEPNVMTTGLAPNSIIPPPMSRSVSYYTPWPGVIPAANYFNEIPMARYEYPDGSNAFRDLRYGTRVSTTMGGYQFGAFYWHTQEFTPVIERGGTVGTTDLGAAIGIPGFWIVPNREYIIRYPEVNIFGASVNKDMPLGVIRAEMTYRPSRVYNTFDPAEPSALTRRDNLQYLLAWDFSTACRPLSETGPLDITMEYLGNWIFGNTDYLGGTGYLTPTRRDDHTFLFMIGTGWNYDNIHASVTTMYSVQNNGMVMPDVKWNPDVLNKALSFDLKYIYVFGKDDFEGLGLMRQKSMVVLTSQFSF